MIKKIALLVLFASSIALPSHAAFPGRNGKIAFAHDRGDIYVVASRGGSPRRLDFGRGRFFEPVWSPDGRRLVFSCRRPEQDAELCLWHVGRQRMRSVTQNEEVDGQPSWSPDGQTILFVRSEGPFGATGASLMTKELGGGAAEAIAFRPQALSHPRYSPDGTQIAFASMGTMGEFDLYVINADGSGERNLTSSSARENNPSWSPDGRSIAFDIYNEADDPEDQAYLLHLYDFESGEVTELPDGRGLAPAWSPNGNNLTFYDLVDSRMVIFKIRVDGSARTRLTGRSYDARSPDWQPRP